MPILCNVPIPAEGLSAEEKLAEFLDRGSPYGDITTLREYRFSGYHLVYDSYGNILSNRPYSSQPAFWSFRATYGANLDMR
jgi:hypothetical protein